MENLTLGNKAVILCYIVAANFLANSTFVVAVESWHLFAYLIYLSVNIAYYIFRSIKLKLLLAAASICYILFVTIYSDPLFILLIPISIYELIGLFSKNKLLTLLCMLLPIAIVNTPDLKLLYLLSTFISFMMYAYVCVLNDKLVRIEQERETLRENVQRLTHSLSENTEYIRQSEYTIKLEERNRLSQQIHDDIGHSMAGALIQMEASRRLLATNQEKAAELLGNAIAISKDGLERIRLTLKDLKPSSEELGINRLRLFVDELSTKETVIASLTYDGDIDRITPIQWQIIQKNATEAVTNALKYAEATAIHIEIRVLNKFIKAVVSDNGRGAVKLVKGLGIIGMEERAATVGGTVIVDGTKGFSVTTLLPSRNE
ncbi:sensor histidine kinase [Paenibacillus albiflavus]|uniref:histidine kinase n=1 Tax=Paenibacillus albiflavus TaxID=2545760 RepID=A0A4V6P6B2_9BACL|nr:sensor histidine kinase [Paenibacillus albiflavus]TCZ76622.1 sensor histidine kinase [Paenibacillus albiflavus]